jgi:hypothetical protein
MWRLAMIPKIKRIKETDNHPFRSNGYMVGGKFCWDSCDTLGRAIRYWLWHCGVPAKIAFFGIKKS